jgi:hypothetical protein
LPGLEAPTEGRQLAWAHCYLEEEAPQGGCGRAPHPPATPAMRDRGHM